MAPGRAVRRAGVLAVLGARARDDYGGDGGPRNRTREFFWQWSAQNDKRPIGNDLIPHFPESCQPGPNVLHCGKAGLKGTLSVDGVGKRYSAAMVKVVWLDGQSRVYTITSAQLTARLYG